MKKIKLTPEQIEELNEKIRLFLNQERSKNY